MNSNEIFMVTREYVMRKAVQDRQAKREVQEVPKPVPVPVIQADTFSAEVERVKQILARHNRAIAER